VFWVLSADRPGNTYSFWLSAGHGIRVLRTGARASAMPEWPAGCPRSWAGR